MRHVKWVLLRESNSERKSPFLLKGKNVGCDERIAVG